MADDEPFELPLHDTPEPQGPALVVDVDGYEGPLDLLLTLARNQKVDLTQHFGARELARAVSRLHRRRCASVAPRACRRLSGHGGVACLSEIEAC